MPEAPKKRGRPTKRTPEVDETIIRCLSSGLGYGTAAMLVGIIPETLREWRHQDPAFSARCQNAIASTREIAAVALMKQIKAGNIQAIKLYMDRRVPEFREKVEIVDTDPETKKRRRIIMQRTDRRLRPQQVEDLDAIVEDARNGNGNGTHNA